MKDVVSSNKNTGDMQHTRNLKRQALKLYTNSRNKSQITVSTAFRCLILFSTGTTLWNWNQEYFSAAQGTSGHTSFHFELHTQNVNVYCAKRSHSICKCAKRVTAFMSLYIHSIISTWIAILQLVILPYARIREMKQAKRHGMISTPIWQTADIDWFLQAEKLKASKSFLHSELLFNSIIKIYINISKFQNCILKHFLCQSWNFERNFRSRRLDCITCIAIVSQNTSQIKYRLDSNFSRFIAEFLVKVEIKTRSWHFSRHSSPDKIKLCLRWKFRYISIMFHQ